jgi:lipoyl(octanoyl) transferase
VIRDQVEREALSRAQASAPHALEAHALECISLGLVPYGEALGIQDDLVQRRRASQIADQLLLLQHPHVITLGTSSHTDNVLIDASERALLGIELYDTGRGGDVTYHGPGQLVGYPILDLKPDRCDLHGYVRDIEESLIRALAEFDINASRKSGLTGVWVQEEKIAAIGVRVSSGWITSHGFALNINTDLAFFDAIVPCGIKTRGVTSMTRLLGHVIDIETIERSVARHFAQVFARELLFVESANIARRT